MQLNSDRDDEHDDDSFGSEGSRPVERSYKPIDAVGSVGLPLEKRLRSRIDNFLAGYRLTRMGKAIALSWIQSIGSDTTGDFARVRGWLLGQLNAFGSSSGISATPCASRAGISRWQKGCPEIIPGVRSKAFWSSEDFDLPWVTEFAEGFRDAREELLALRGRGGFQPYRAPRGRSRDGDAVAAKDGVGSHCHEGGDWNVFYLFLHDAVDFSENRSMCPKTVSLVEALPRHHKHAFLSALAPGTHVLKHNGPTNKKLRVHLPLLAPGGGLSRLRVGSETREVVAGQALVFDDSFEHEAWNDDDGDSNNDDDEPLSSQGVATENARAENGSDRHRKPSGGVDQEIRGRALDEEKWRAEEGTRGRRRASTRVTLIADVWHPDLSNREVRFLAFLQDAALRLEKRLVEGGGRKTADVPQGGVHRMHSGDDDHHDKAIDIISGHTGGQVELPSPPTSATTVWQGEDNNTTPTESTPPGVGDARVPAGWEMSDKNATTVATSSHAPAADGQQANTSTDDPDGCNNVSEHCSERVLEETEGSVRGVRDTRGGGDASCDAEGTAVVAADNFLEVINRARALCSDENNIFGA